MGKFSRVLWFITIQYMVLMMLICLLKTAREVYPPKLMGTHVHWNLYIDKNIEPVYVEEIKIATARWSKATNGIADFNVEVITSENRNKIRHDADAMIITTLTEDRPDVIHIDEGNNESTVAFCNIRADLPVLAYVEGRVTDDIFQKVTMHELGHALRLEHDPDGFGEIMFPSTDLMGTVITQKDLEQFCKIYKCDATKLKNEEEPLHL